MTLLPVYALAAMAGVQADIETPQNVPAEIVFHASLAHANPFETVTLDVDFTDPDGHTRRVPAFWDGGELWKARYASPVLGAHPYRTVCSDHRDLGLDGQTGAVDVKPYAGANPLFSHGPVRVARDRRHLAYADGTPFFWLGDTWWMGLAQRLRWPDEFQALTADRVAKGFTVVQVVAGLYPDMFAFDPRGANEAGFPWTGNAGDPPTFETINPAYFDRADERLRYLVDQGITPCIVGAWGYFMPWMGVDRLKRHWRYLVARYGSLPVVWCAAGEANLPWYLVKGFAYDDREQVHGWTEVLRYIRATDPFRRPLTVHPTAINRYTARHATDDERLLDFDMLQTPHGEEGAAETTLKAAGESWAAKPQMPWLDGEAAYEMLSDSLPTQWTRAMFWICMLNGAAGHTYGANGIWQNNRPGDPHGKSPHGGTYGQISSQDAMHLPGSAQLAAGKRLFERYDWPHFRPHPEWASYEGATDPIPPQAAGTPRVRFIYLLRSHPTVVHGLAGRWRASVFDPVSGDSAAIGPVSPDKVGDWRYSPPPTWDHDAVLVFEK